MKLLNGSGCRFPGPGGNEGFPGTIDYDSRRTGNGSLDAGSTPAYSIICDKGGSAEWEDTLSPGRCIYYLGCKREVDASLFWYNRVRVLKGLSGNAAG